LAGTATGRPKVKTGIVSLSSFLCESRFRFLFRWG
jgi:hypothetical protein